MEQFYIHFKERAPERIKDRKEKKKRPEECIQYEIALAQYS